MHIPWTASKRLALFFGLLSLFASTMFSQRLSRGSKLIERSLPDASEAFCSDLPHELSVCKVRENEDGEAEFIIKKGEARVNTIEAPFWGIATGGGPTDFFAYRGDLDGDRSSEIVLVSLEGVSQGMGVTYATAHIFDGRTLEVGGVPISIPIQEFGDGENFIYNGRTGRTDILITYWSDYDTIEPKRNSGRYLVGKWFRYEKARLVPILTRPTLARRFLNSFSVERDNGWFENRRPYTWLKDRRTFKLSREPKLTEKLLHVRSGTITALDERKGESSEFTVAFDNGESIKAKFGYLSEEEKGSVLRVDGVGIATKNYLYPNPSPAGIPLSSFFEKIDGRQVRLETYVSIDGDKFGRLWLLN